MPGRDSVRPPGDSAAAATAAPPAPAPPPPVDPALRTACGRLVAPALAPDLLVIAFNPEVDGPGRAAVAKNVGGSVVGPTGSGMADSYYLKVPAKGSGSLLRAIADRLIVRPEVRQVGTKLCPPTAPPEAKEKPKS